MELNAKEVIKKAFRNKEYLEISKCCGCYHCAKKFVFTEIVQYVDNEETAICPYCGMDSVIGTEMGFNITTSFLEQLSLEIFWKSPKH